MSASWYIVLNRRCLPEHLDMALGSTRVPWARGLVAPAVGLSSACCSGTPSPPFDYTPTCVLRGGASVLGGGATRAPSSSNHSDIAALRV